MTGRFHTARDVGEMFDKSEIFVKRRAATGDWPAFKVGQEWRFTDEDIEAITRIGRREDTAQRVAPLVRSSRRRRKAAS